MLAAVPPSRKGRYRQDARWIVSRVQAGYASPVSDGQLLTCWTWRRAVAFEAKTASSCGTRRSARLRRPSPVLADGKLYVGTETVDAGGKFFISGRRLTKPRSSYQAGSARR